MIYGCGQRSGELPDRLTALPLMSPADLTNHADCLYGVWVGKASSSPSSLNRRRIAVLISVCTARMSAPFTQRGCSVHGGGAERPEKRLDELPFCGISTQG